MHRRKHRRVLLSAGGWKMLYDLIEDELERGEELRAGNMWEAELAAYYARLDRLRSRIGWKGSLAFENGTCPSGRNTLDVVTFRHGGSRHRQHSSSGSFSLKRPA
jgi:hypothetical protein